MAFNDKLTDALRNGMVKPVQEVAPKPDVKTHSNFSAKKGRDGGLTNALQNGLMNKKED